jgi:hypothetical protein
MTRLFAYLVVFAFASPAFADPIASDKNWGDKQTAQGKKSDKIQSKTKLHEKEGKFDLEKEKIVAFKRRK